MSRNLQSFELTDFFVCAGEIGASSPKDAFAKTIRWIGIK
jgi:hypothetical protein